LEKKQKSHGWLDSALPMAQLARYTMLIPPARWADRCGKIKVPKESLEFGLFIASVSVHHA
jgi:hypothetical protein